MKRSSSLDCTSIGQSLKRVKISTSPGELRLDRDIESLISSQRWTSTAHRQTPPPPQGSSSIPSWDRKGSRIHSELLTPNARLVRDPVDPLRLRLTCLHPPTQSPSSHPELWTFLIQMPRMYPHVPPVVGVHSRHFVPNNDENMAHLGNIASASIVPSSGTMQNNLVEPPIPEQILIRPLPPTPNSQIDDCTSSDGSKLLDFDLATSIFNKWSPIVTLQELIDFLVEIPTRRREWWSVESNRRHHQQQQQRFIGSYASSPLNHPTIAPTAISALGNIQQQQHNHQMCHSPRQNLRKHQLSSSPCDMEDDGDMNSVEPMMMDAGGGMSPERRAFKLDPNRFDVGYDRSESRRWGVR